TPEAPQQPPQQEQAAAPAPQQQQAAPQQQATPQQQAQPQSAPPAPAPAAPASTTDSADTPYVTPLVRKLASENAIDLNSLTGSGVGGRIRKQDVLAAIEQQQQQQQQQQPAATTSQPSTPQASAPAPSGSGSGSSASTEPDLSGLRGTTQKASRIRQITAEKTKESLQTSAQLTQVHEVDVTRIAKLRQQAKQAFREREGVSLTFLPFFAKATVEALKQHPNVNAAYNEEPKEITYHGSVHLGIAVDTDRGLLSVVIHDAGELSIAGLAHRIADLADRARNNDVKPNEL